jgi:hypothetical protein
MNNSVLILYLLFSFSVLIYNEFTGILLKRLALFFKVPLTELASKSLDLCLLWSNVDLCEKFAYEAYYWFAIDEFELGRIIKEVYSEILVNVSEYSALFYWNCFYEFYESYESKLLSDTEFCLETMVSFEFDWMRSAIVSKVIKTNNL